MGKIHISITIDNGHGSFGCNMQQANLTELTLANAKLDLLKANVVSQIDKALKTQSNIGFEKKE